VSGAAVCRFVGNDVVDLAAARERWVDADARWIARHLTPAEGESLQAAPAEDRARLFWSLFAAKEAASKAFAQAGIEIPPGGFTCIEVDLRRARAREVASGREAAILFPLSDEEKIHALALVPEEAVADDDIVHGVANVPAGRDPSAYVRERLTLSASRRSGIARREAWVVGRVGGRPQFLVSGRWLDWSVSLSHAGRFAAWSCLVLPASA
jgi:phosphopantetheine--protein transferase-like protein